MNTRDLRIVGLEEWVIDTSLGDRRQRLLDVPTPMELAESVAGELLQTTERGEVELCWQEACESPDYFRLIAYVPLSEIAFDQLFNGRSGYRAQYYLSPEEGVLFNRLLLDELAQILRHAHHGSGVSAEPDVLASSIMAPHAKLWIYDERPAFDAATPDMLNPPRWVSNGATRGRKALLPDRCILEIKGSFVEPGTGKIFEDPYKLERPLDLFNKGYT